MAKPRLSSKVKMRIDYTVAEARLAIHYGTPRTSVGQWQWKYKRDIDALWKHILRLEAELDRRPK